MRHAAGRSEAEPFSFANQHGRVCGFAGPWSADASIVPREVSVPPDLMVIATGRVRREPDLQGALERISVRIRHNVVI